MTVTHVTVGRFDSTVDGIVISEIYSVLPDVIIYWYEYDCITPNAPSTRRHSLSGFEDHKTRRCRRKSVPLGLHTEKTENGAGAMGSKKTRREWAVSWNGSASPVVYPRNRERRQKGRTDLVEYERETLRSR
jgi:hypothetical protein